MSLGSFFGKIVAVPARLVSTAIDTLDAAMGMPKQPNVFEDIGDATEEGIKKIFDGNK